jgi:hypothetical protein
MTLPAIHQAINMVIRGKNYLVTCLDVFDAGYGYYFDALFPDAVRIKFAEGESCAMPGFGMKGSADYASHPKGDKRTVRFLISKWG